VRYDVILADRRKAVRDAAQAWHAVGAIDDSARLAITALYPDDRARLGLGLRILAGLAALIGGGALAALLGLLLRPDGWIPTFALGLAAFFAGATEFQVGRLRRAQAGAEYATALLAVILAGCAWGVFSDFDEAGFAIGLALICFFAAWRWGYTSFAALAAFFALAACCLGAHGREACILFGAVGQPMILRLARSRRWSPSHRWCFLAMGLVFVAGAYLAINVYSFDHRWLESFGRVSAIPAVAWMRPIAIAATIAVPPFLVVVGVLYRDRWLLAAGALFTAASLVTLRQYHPVGPWWFSLLVGGAACLALAVGLRRWLEAGVHRERRGWTARPLFGDGRIVAAAQAAATLVAMSPGARVAGDKGFEGGGGRSGGGGATGGA